MQNIGIIYKKDLTEEGNEEITGSLSPIKHRKIVKIVVITHLLIILVPVIWYAISSLFTPKKLETIKVSIVTSSAPVNTINYQPPTKIPTHQSQPQKKHKSIKSTRKKIIKKTWKPKSSKQITISKKIIRNNNYTPPKQLHSISRKDIESKLKRISSKNITYSNTTSATATMGNVSQSYKDKLYTAIYKAWQQPSKSALGGRFPIVNISMTLEKNGEVRNLRISTLSGIKAMDDSVRELIKKLKRLPPPPNRMTFSVSLEIIN